MITTKDKIGYIRRQENPDGTTTFKFIEAKIKYVRIGIKGTSVYSDKFRALDAEELEDNTELMADTSELILVGEPFVMNDEMSERLKKVVDGDTVYEEEEPIEAEEVDDFYVDF